MVDCIGRGHFYKKIGITMGCGALGGIIGPTVAGWVYDSFGTYHSIWLVFSCLAILGIMLALRVTPGADQGRRGRSPFVGGQESN